jgi:hypothetical protein
MDLRFHIQIPDGRAESATFPAELSVGQLLNEFVTDDKMRIQPADPEHWVLFNENTGQELDPRKSLEQNGVGKGHMLKLVPRKRPHVNPSEPGPGSSLKLIRCEKGHYYDPKKHTKCPFCAEQAIKFGPRRLTIEPSSDERTSPYDHQPPPGRPRVGDDVPTRPPHLVPDSAKIDPVVGWLVAIAGPEKGRDYRIRSENNTIGRSPDMHISIPGDDAISRERHSVITFDPQRNAFHLSPGESRGLVYLNGEALLSHKQLAPYDEIMLGETKLLFVPLCGDKFKWE